MLRVRKLVLAMAAASALSSGMAHALGLGEVTLKSALNQPLEAEIELVEARDLAPNEVLPSLASPEEFNKAGVERQFFLSDLKFTPIIKPNGKSVIRVTSTKSVREPYLNFLVEVLWPNGRLLREYTVLLDPPLYSPQAAAAPRAPVTAPIARTTVAPAPRPAVRPSAPAPRPASQVATAPAAPKAANTLSGNEYRTKANDNLWDIAQRSRQNGNINQTMLAIQDLNPDAFVDGNINRMKRGQVLRLPDQAQINARSQSEALAQVAEQNAAWREGRSVAAGARQLDATKREVAGAAPAKAQAGDSLKLVSGETGKATAGSDKGQADSSAISNKLAVTQESLDSTRRENEELGSRMTDLQSQLDKLQRLIKLKDDQLAKLQADLAAGGAAAGAAATSAAPAAAAEPAAPAAPAAPTGETPAEPSAPQAPVADQPDAANAVQADAAAEKPAADAAAEPDFNYSEEPVAKADAPAQEPAAQPAVVPEPAAAKPAAPVVAAEPAQTSAVDDMLANPMLLGIVGGGGLLALLVLLMMISRRKALKEAEADNTDFEPDNSFAVDSELPADSFDGLQDDYELDGPASDETSPQRITPQTADVLGEADIYIAYGRFNQAAELLQNAINDEPERADLHLKLMEVYAEMGDRDGFAHEAQALRDIGGANEQVAQLSAKYPAMAVLAGAGLAGAALTPAATSSTDDDLDSFNLDDLVMDDVEPVQPTPTSAATLDDSFDLSLDDLEADLEKDLQAAAPNDLDSFDLETELAQNTPAADKADDLGFELGLEEEGVKHTDLADELADFSFDLDNTPASDSSDEFMLDLDDDLNDDLLEVSSTNSLPEPSAAASFDAGSDAAGNDFELPDDFDLSLSDDVVDVAPDAKPDNFAAQLDEVSAELDQLTESLEQKPVVADESDLPEFTEETSAAAFDDDDDFDFLSGTDETATKLDLARAYIDMGDSEGARDILDEVVAEGNEDQQKEAQELIAKMV